MENTQFVTDAELLGYINAAYLELYDLLVSRFEDYFMSLDPTTHKPPTFTLAGGVNTYVLPSDLYKLRGIDVQINAPNDWNKVYRYNLDERNSRSKTINRLQYGMRVNYYRVIGNVINFLPEDQSDGTYRLWYVPRLVRLVNDSDDTAGNTLDYEEYIVVDAAIKCLLKEESEVSQLLAIKEGIRQRVIAMSANRDSGAQERVADVRFGSGDSSGFQFPR